jgi:ABC-type lipoprotein release transport system permease subunit
MGVSLAVGLLAAVLPAWRAARVGIAEALTKVG